MLARLFFGLLLVSATFAQATILPAWWPLEVRPNLVLILLLVWTALNSVREGAVWAAGIGILLDILAVAPLGSNGLSLLVVVLIAGLARQRIFQSALLLPFTLAIVAGFLQPLVLLLISDVAGRDSLPIGVAVRTIAPQAILCALLVPPVYIVANWFAQRLSEVRR